MLSDDFPKSRCPGFVAIYFPALQSVSDRILVRPMVQEISRTPKTAILARQRGFSEVSETTSVQSVTTILELSVRLVRLDRLPLYSYLGVVTQEVNPPLPICFR